MADATQFHSDGGQPYGKYRETNAGKSGGESSTKSIPYPVGARLQGAGGEPRNTTDAQTGQPVQLDSETRGQWSVEPAVGRVAHGVPRRVDRLKALGNAVVPQVVTEIGKAILAQ